MSFIDGLSSGLDTTSIINQLMAIERRPQLALIEQRDQRQAAKAELSAIRSDINALRDLAADFRLNSTLETVSATSSNPTAVSVVPGTAATTGTYTFEVTSVATAAAMYSTNLYAGLDTVVTTPGADVFQASSYESLGFSDLTGTGLASGPVAFEVVQDSAAASVRGAGLTGGPYTIGAGNDSLIVDVNGTSYTLTLAHGSYADYDALAGAVADAVAAHGTAGDVMIAEADDANSAVQLSTIAEGSDHTITITGGTAAASLGLSPGASATGTDGIVEVDGTQTAITDTTDGVVVTLPSGAGGSIDATIGGAIRSGTATVTNSPVDGGTVAELVAEVNQADLGYTAMAVDTGAGYRIQLTADEPGADSDFTPDAGIFEGMAFTVLADGSDAELTIDGVNPFTVTSTDNTFDGLLPGVTITVNDVTAGPVTVTTERDTETVATKVDEFITTFNTLLTRIADATRNDPDGQRTVLQGNREARRAADQLRSTFFEGMDDHPLTSVGLVGIELTRDGAITFNQDAFAQALVDGATDVMSLFIDPTSGTGVDAVPGAFDRLIETAEAMASTGDGLLYTSAESSDRVIADYDRQIEAYERRLEAREEYLRRVYANLEVALGGLADQSAYLQSQISQLSSLSPGRNEQ